MCEMEWKFIFTVMASVGRISKLAFCPPASPSTTPFNEVKRPFGLGVPST